MSRIYLALQKSSRTVEKSAVESGKPGGDGAPVLNYAEDLGAIAPVDALEAENHTGSEQGDQVLPANGSRNGSLGVPARVVLDQAARLIPNAVDGTVVEHYRRLRAKVLQEQERKPFRSLLVTSPNPGDGKSVTALNLALSFGMLPSYRVLVLDGDLRRGSLGKWLGVSNHPGLSNLLEGSAELEDVVLKCDEIPVYFMVRGSAATAPAELLHSPRLIQQLRKMTEHFSLVLVDSPPVNLVSDAQQLAAGCDAALLVARAFATTRKAVQEAVQDLSPFRVIGTVLNGGMRADLHRYYKHYK